MQQFESAQPMTDVGGVAIFFSEHPQHIPKTLRLGYRLIQVTLRDWRNMQDIEIHVARYGYAWGVDCSASMTRFERFSRPVLKIMENQS
jgi:hypothetical protein